MLWSTEESQFSKTAVNSINYTNHAKRTKKWKYEATTSLNIVLMPCNMVLLFQQAL